MGTPASFKINEGSEKLIIERTHPSKSHLYVQGFTALGAIAFLLLGRLLVIYGNWYSNVPEDQLLKWGIILFAPLTYIGLSLIYVSWRTKETLTLDKQSGLLTYSKIGKHPWLIIKKNGSIGTLPPFTIEYFYFPLKDITSVHSMTVDTVDEFEDYLVLYFEKINAYMAIWEYSFESTRVGHKVPDAIASFLGQVTGEEINKPLGISFNLSFVNDLFRSVSNGKNDNLRVDPKKAFLSYDHKLALSASLLTLEICRRMVKENPNDAYARLMLGLACLGQLGKEAAIEHLQVAHQLFISRGDKRHAKRVQNYLTAVKPPV